MSTPAHPSTISGPEQPSGRHPGANLEGSSVRIARLVTLLGVLAAAGAAGAATRFVDVTAASGVRFQHSTGAFGQRWLPETMGSGVVVLDANGDERPDLFFVNGRSFAGRPGAATSPALYRNLGGMRFEEVTKEAGLAESAYCLGGAAGDLDNDGDTDLYVSCLGRDRLYINDGGRFTERGTAAGLSQEEAFGASVALLDADHDGLLDIFATRYVTWNPQSDIRCSLDGTNRSYCTPEPYKGASPRFYRNLGDGTFEDRTRAAGVFQPAAKALGVAVLDVDGDGWSDLAVSNDTQPNLLYRNRGDGSFEEVGLLSGMAFSESGVARGGMGIDAVDFDRSGRQSLVIGNFANEMVALYANEGNLLFVDVAPSARIGRPTLLSLSFATFFFDYDLDGLFDLLVANGHLEPDIEKIQPRVRYRQPTQLFRNSGGGRFVETTADAGGDLAAPRVARGAAWADFDFDGDPDVVLTTNGGPAALFENRGDGHGHWLQVDLQGKMSNRDGLGATVEVTTGDGTTSWLVRAGSSYLSQSQVSPIFGLGGAEKADKVVVRWPSGTVQTLSSVAADRRLPVVEEPPPRP